MTEEIKKQFDAFYLFVRNDEKVQELQNEIHDFALAIKDVHNTLAGLDKRVNLGLAVTGQNNEKAIAEEKIEVGKLRTTVDLLNQSINNPETGVFKQIKEIKEAVGLIYKGIVGIFFTILCGGVILYVFKFR